MLKDFETITAKLTLEPFQMEGLYSTGGEGKGRLQFSAGKVNLPDIEQSKLPLCFSLQTISSGIFRSGPIDTLDKALEALALADRSRDKNSNKPLRAAILQLDNPLESWSAIRLQHALIYQASGLRQVAHFNLSTPNFFTLRSAPEETLFQIKNIEKLSREINYEGWQTYCNWLNELIESALLSVKLDDTAKYQLEGYLRAFSHECTSVLLDKHLKDQRQFLLQFAELDQQKLHHPHDIQELNSKLLEIEKQIYRISGELKNTLNVEYELLKGIQQEFQVLHVNQDNLKNLIRPVLLLKKLLQGSVIKNESDSASWVQKVMLRQLLNDELGIVTLINCETGLEKTHLAFALSLAVAELKQKYPIDSVIDCAIRFDETVLTLNQKLLEIGFQNYKEWCHQKSVPPEEVNLHRRAIIIEKLRKMNFRALMDLCLPIQQLFSAKNQGDIEGTWRVEPYYLEALPSNLSMKFDESTEWVPYVRYDKESAKAIDLEPRGYATLGRFMSSV